MSSLLDKQKTIMDQLVAGDFVTGMEMFYADDAVNEEGNGTSAQGKDKIVANEKRLLEGVQAYHGCTVHAVGAGPDDGAGNGVTFAQYDLQADLKGGSTFNPKQVQVTRWEDGKAKRITFYYDPSKLSKDDLEQAEKELEDRAMSNQELHQVRERLERKLADLGARRIEGLELGAGDETEQALLEMEADLAVATANADWRITRDVRSALQRIETSEYGVCESCEKPIAESRLRALPWASRCVRCQAAEEEPTDGSLQFARFKADVSGVFAGAAQ